MELLFSSIAFSFRRNVGKYLWMAVVGQNEQIKYYISIVSTFSHDILCIFFDSLWFSCPLQLILPFLFLPFIVLCVSSSSIALWWFRRKSPKKCSHTLCVCLACRCWKAILLKLTDASSFLYQDANSSTTKNRNNESNCTWWRVTHKNIPLHLSTFRFFFLFILFSRRLGVRRFQCKCKSILWFMFFCYVKFPHWEFIVTLRVVLLFSFLLFAVRTDFPHWNIARDVEAKTRNFSTTIVAPIWFIRKMNIKKNFSFFSHY